MKEEFYAHSREGRPPEEWHRLEDHLKRVAEIAKKFSGKCGEGKWILVGLSHDLGCKYEKIICSYAE